MLRGLNTAVTGMVTSQRRHDTITNNIANMNTTGYKNETVVTRTFADWMIDRQQRDAFGDVRTTAIGTFPLVAMAEEALAHFGQGDVLDTGNPLDVALVSNIGVAGLTFDAAGKAVTPEGDVRFQPQAMFAVRSADGTPRYTRNGQFAVDVLGQLVTANGDLVLDANRQPIRLPIAPEELSISPEGALYNQTTQQPLVDATGRPLAIAIVRIDNPYALIRDGNGNFRLQGDEPPLVGQADDVRLYQGRIERSNVDAARASVDLMTAQRAYESNQRIVQFLDKSLEKAVNEVGRV